MYKNSKYALKKKDIGPIVDGLFYVASLTHMQWMLGLSLGVGTVFARDVCPLLVFKRKSSGSRVPRLTFVNFTGYRS